MTDARGAKGMADKIYSLEDILAGLVANGLDVRTVLDVGVRYGTPALMEAFPAKPHFLFEPMVEYNDIIRKRYAAIEHEIVNVACGADDGNTQLVKIFRSGREALPTHSQMLRPGIDPSLGTLEEIERLSMDTFIAARNVQGPFLLKIDVDGLELDVLRGAQETLKSCAAVVLEMTRHSFFRRMSFMENNGFSMHSLGDIAYGSMSPDVAALRPFDTGFRQCDVVFLPKTMNADAQFCPLAAQKKLNY